ncbi:MAG: tRNA lysidine(34) synthetase TilS [Gammaproteobacteria bacterium]
MENTPNCEADPAAAVRAVLDARLRPGDAAAVALSGGMDSVSLLDAALRSGARRDIFACHVNHGISAAADSWERFCRRLCESRGVRCIVRRAAPPAGDASEKWARQVRMQAFAGLPARAVIAAHHADDQAETALFRVLRGSGAHGLGAMRPFAPLPGAADMLLLRPWLGLARSEIADYARRRRLSWVEDDDNRNLARRRNFLRRRAMPVLREYFPGCGSALAATAARLGAASALLAGLADEDEQRAGGEAGGLDLAYFESAGAARLQNWLHVRLLRASAKFSERGLAEAARQIIGRRDGLALRLGGLTLRVWRRRLYLDELPPPPDFFRMPLETGQERHDLPQLGGALMLREIIGGGLSGGKTGGRLFAQLRRGGERLHVSDSRERAVSDLLREANIAPWRRRRLPLLFVGDALAAVPGVAVAAAFRAGRREKGIECRMEWF